MSTSSSTGRSLPSASLVSALDFATTKRQLTGHLALVLEEDVESFGRMFLSLSSAGCPATLVRRWAQFEPMVRRTRASLILFSTRFDDSKAANTIRRLREDPATTNAILVAIADHESRKERHHLLKLGCDGYVWKPADRYLFAMDVVGRTQRLLDSNCANRDRRTGGESHQRA